MGTLYERNQKSLKELKDGYDGMLVILQQFLSNQKTATLIPSAFRRTRSRSLTRLGLIPKVPKILRTAALLSNVNEIGISNEILYKAANLSEEDLEKGMRKGETLDATKAQLMGGSLRRAIPILVAAQQLNKTGANPADSIVEVQILNLAEKFEAQTNAVRFGKDAVCPGGGKDRERIRRQVRFDDCGCFCKSLRTKGAGGWQSKVTIRQLMMCRCMPVRRLAVPTQSLPHFHHARLSTQP